MTTFEARAGDIVSITGKLTYGIGGKKGYLDDYVFLTTEDGTAFTVQKAPHSAWTIVKTTFFVGDTVRKQRGTTPGEVKAIVNDQAFVLWSTGFATAEEFADLVRYEDEPHHAAQIDIEEYLAPVQPPLTPAQVAEIEAEAEASELPDIGAVRLPDASEIF